MAIVLSELLGRSGPLPIRDAVNYTLQVAYGLSYAHSEGVVHRDIKPGNLLLDKRGNVKILDMGLARMEETAAAIAEHAATDSLTKAGQVLGTLDYMSPEQAEDAHEVDHRTDIYSLGCTFFRLLTGRPPYKGKTIVNKIVAHKDHPIPSLVEARAGVPSDLDAVFRRMVAKRPEDRLSVDERDHPRPGVVPLQRVRPQRHDPRRQGLGTRWADRCRSPGKGQTVVGQSAGDLQAGRLAGW